MNEALLNGGKTTPTKLLGRNVKEFTSRLHAAAADDLAVLTLIDLHLQDITERGQICHITGMKPGAYHNAFLLSSRALARRLAARHEFDREMRRSRRSGAPDGPNSNWTEAITDMVFRREERAIPGDQVTCSAL